MDRERNRCFSLDNLKPRQGLCNGQGYGLGVDFHRLEIHHDGAEIFERQQCRISEKNGVATHPAR